ncbi:MAG: NADH-quinone oxidoreductase subunit C [Micrococcales bacterium]|nr:MAG: NADH-quinone oxidoreductase subunit C [Micrococcales bacterium]PIE26666.1 MAG: NADH-quinone oxidoreductase subunit C [Micrococcales bacterium]
MSDDEGAVSSPGPVTAESAQDEDLAGVAGRPGPNVVAVREGMFGVAGSGDTSGFGGLVTTITMPGPSERPYGGWFDEAVDVLAEMLDEEGEPGFGEAIEQVVVDRGELTVYVQREHLLRVAQVLRDDPDLRFEMCMGVNGVHYPAEAGRELHAVYPLRSLTHNRRLRLEVACPDADPHVPSLCEVYPANNWHERETFDFFGIVFDGHPALTRIEMPDDWLGHPQRKDYPLGGIPVEYKGATVSPPDTRRQYR